MTSPPDISTGTAPRPARTWAGHAAFAWAAIFASMSLYWAAGGQIGGRTIGAEIYQLGRERDPSFVAELVGRRAALPRRDQRLREFATRWCHLTAEPASASSARVRGPARSFALLRYRGDWI
jgi:hypothetical protein